MICVASQNHMDSGAQADLIKGIQWQQSYQEPRNLSLMRSWPHLNGHEVGPTIVSNRLGDERFAAARRTI